MFETLLDEQAKKVLDFTDLIANWDHYPKVGEALVLPTTYRKDVHIERKLKKIYLDRSIFKSKPTNDKFLITGIYNKIPPYFLYDFLDLDAFFEDTSRSSRIFFTNGDVLEGKVHDLWATLKKIDPYANLHVLDYDLEKLQWKKSYGDLSFVRNFLKTDDENYYSKRYLIDKKNLYNYFVLSDKPGMGKTHFLSFLANYYKRFYPSVWVVNQNLNACIQSLEQIEALRPLALGENTYTKGIVIDFLQQVMRLNTDFEKKLFSHYLNTNKVILLFDGFDEMTHRHQQIFIEILKILKEFNIKLLGVTTRPFYQIQLEEALACFSFALTSFSRADQISLITKIWLSDSKNLVAANHLVQKAAIFSNKLVQDLQLPHDAESSLMAIPLQVYLLACQFKEKFWDSIESDSMQRLDIHTDLLKLYRYFIDETYRIYYEKLGWDSSYKERIREEILRFNQQLELMAIRQLFPEFQEAILDALGVEFEYLIPNEALKSLGFISIYDNKIFFIHKNFLEYFASQWLIKNLHHVKLDKLVTDILKKIVNSAEVSYIRLFFDFSLQKPLLHDYILNKRTKLQDYFATTAEVFFNSVDAVGRTALHIAALYNSDKISLLLENGLDLRKKDNLDWTALDYAIAIKNWDAVNNLAKKYLGLTGPFSELSEKVFLQEHFLHVAARRNWKILIELAVKVTPSDKKLDLINHANAEGDTALHIAARYGWVEFADLLFQQGAYDRPNENANTAMDIAAEAGQVNFIAFLFEKRELLDGRRDYYQIQHSPLISAVQENGLSTVQYLLNKHVDLTTADSKGNTALHLAALLDNEIILAVLLNEYAKVDVKNLDGQTPLHYAAERGNIKSMQRLLAKGADLYLKQKEGDTPLHLMLLSLLKKEHEKLAYIKTLLARPATDVEIVGMEGNHLLHYAAGEGNSELIRYLLDIKNGEIDPKNFYGFTPLFFAVKEGHEEAMDFLLERNADIFQKDSNGETVAHLAAYRGHLSILKKLLQKKPALINSRNKKGNSILDLA
ncbi:MAG: ankyrin repeat domain-containing protein, partial [Rickettsia endosymbiont of Ixodes persulcatus]|nr:ankyrin repeat domain-containing protein [Rickettsia endosymbiont of Ixodes persulcatus]